MHALPPADVRALFVPSDPAPACATPFHCTRREQGSWQEWRYGGRAQTRLSRLNLKIMPSFRRFLLSFRNKLTATRLACPNDTGGWRPLLRQPATRHRVSWPHSDAGPQTPQRPGTHVGRWIAPAAGTWKGGSHPMSGSWPRGDAGTHPPPGPGTKGDSTRFIQSTPRHGKPLGIRPSQLQRGRRQWFYTTRGDSGDPLTAQAALTGADSRSPLSISVLRRNSDPRAHAYSGQAKRPSLPRASFTRTGAQGASAPVVAPGGVSHGPAAWSQLHRAKEPAAPLRRQCAANPRRCLAYVPVAKPIIAVRL